MKTIAELPNDKVLVEMTKLELANICGHHSNISDNFKLNIGVEVKISDIYEKHRLIGALQRSQEYDKARKKLEEMLNALTPIEDKINIIKLP